eukprot:CAMPEP_0113936508 /NCGR_PEP_ID=MMETSP1339-20121228/3413_1 /TAXON_ID=94617 /ORGANISM="Fibrocapsa japonica" /LENGTH=101 /DNA_ID=CAMNT_0000939017 /DNA_START=1 /DNA_END=303 /DNA_ORIENTATION=- /assembly_acc=CAM_ASM_000762
MYKTHAAFFLSFFLLKGESSSYRDALVSGLKKVTDDVIQKCNVHVSSVIYNVRATAHKWSSKLIFRCDYGLLAMDDKGKNGIDQNFLRILREMVDGDIHDA